MIELTRRAILLGGLGLLASPVSAKPKRRKRRDQKKRDRSPHATDAILADVAGRMGHGFRDEGMALDALESRMADGERIEVLCGTQSALGVRALGRRGITARVVGSLTHQPFTGVADGHIMLEARLDKRWQLYDLTANARAVDSDGRGIDVSQLCATSNRHWLTLSDDPLWSDEQVRENTEPWVMDIEAWYERVLGTPWVIDSAGYQVFHDPANEARIVAAYAWAFPVNRETWQALIA